MAVNELELSALIFKGYLPEEDRNDAEACRTRILSRESKQAMRFYTGWAQRGSHHMFGLGRQFAT